MSGRMSASKQINASQLIHRITIQKLTLLPPNENGFELEDWIDLYTVWASKSNLDGREYWTAKAVQSENTVEFNIRYAKFVDAMDSRTYRIVHNTKIYGITFIDNVDFQGKFVRIKTLELVP